MRASAKQIVLCNVVYCSIERQIKEFINSEPKSYLNLREIKNVRGKLVGCFLIRVDNFFFHNYPIGIYFKKFPNRGYGKLYMTVITLK